MSPNTPPSEQPKALTKDEINAEIIKHGRPCSDAEFVGMTGPQHAPIRKGMMVYTVERMRFDPDLEIAVPRSRTILVHPRTAVRKARAAGVNMIPKAEPVPA